MNAAAASHDTHDQAAWRDFFAYNPASRHRYRLMATLVEPLSFGEVLDVGCGDGSLLGALRRRYGCKVFGVDRFESPGIEERLDGFYLMDIARDPPPRAFELVVCSEVLEHVEDDGMALANLRRACTGNLLLTVPLGAIRVTDRHMGHRRHYQLGPLVELVTGAGFDVVRAMAWGLPFMSIYKWGLDRAPGPVMRGFARASYTPAQKALCHLLWALFFLNTSLGGPQGIVLARPRSPVTVL